MYRYVSACMRAWVCACVRVCMYLCVKYYNHQIKTQSNKRCRALVLLCKASFNLLNCYFTQSR